MPTTSPANASSASERSWAKKNCGADSVTGLPVRTSFARMPRWSLPEQTRMKAMRSRWFGSMFAWILNTKPVIFGSSAFTVRLASFLRARARREFGQSVDEVLDAEILERAAPQDGRHMAFEERLLVESLQALDGEVELFDRLRRARARAEARRRAGRRAR